MGRHQTINVKALNAWLLKYWYSLEKSVICVIILKSELAIQQQLLLFPFFLFLAHFIITIHIFAQFDHIKNYITKY